jgi:hypothetical protein
MNQSQRDLSESTLPESYRHVYRQVQRSEIIDKTRSAGMNAGTPYTDWIVQTSRAYL